MLKILLKLKGAELKTFEIDKPVVTIGRNKNNDVFIDNLGISKKHARIVKQQGRYVLEDLKSTNGTLLNDKKVTQALLNGKDVITIGKYTLLVVSSNGKEATQDIGIATIKV
jgi:pSer/pThr/pTyr-binding forkhead associated (FHA) protein